MSEGHSPALREAIEAAYDQAASAAADPAPETRQQPRAEDGKFAAREEAAGAETVEGAAPEPDDYDEAVGLDRDLWRQIPAQARDRAKALAKEAREAAERAKGFEPIDRVISTRRDALRATWGDEARALESLFHLSDWANRDFPGFVQHLARERGVDLRVLMPPPGEPAQPNTRQPPDIERLVDEKLTQREIARQVTDFDGNTAYEFRNDPDVRKVMSGLLASGAASDLPTAYQMATKAIPTVSAKLAERERAAAAKRDAAEDSARRAREAASAAVSVRGAPGTAAPPAAAAPASVRETLERQLERLAGV